MAMTGGLSASNQKNTFGRVETSPFQQTFRFNPEQYGQLQSGVFNAAMGQLGGMGGGGGGFGGLGGGRVGGSFDRAQAGKFTEEYDPILSIMTKGGAGEKLLNTATGDIAEQSERSRQAILERASAGGVLDGGGALRAEILNADQGARAQGQARAQAMLGLTGQAVGATNNQVNAITQAESANAGASASLSGALAQANAGIMAAGIGARAGLMGQQMEMPLRYAQLLDPTFSQGQGFSAVQTGQKSKGANLGVGGR